MPDVTVVALKAFRFDALDVQPGDAVDMPAIQAAVHGRLGNVSLDPMARATYQTKVMVPAVSVPPVLPPSLTVPTRRKRGKRGGRGSSPVPVSA